MEIVPTPWCYYDRSIKYPKLRPLYIVYVQPRKVVGHFLYLSVTQQTIQLCGGSGAERRRGKRAWEGQLRRFSSCSSLMPLPTKEWLLEVGATTSAGMAWPSW